MVKRMKIPIWMYNADGNESGANRDSHVFAEVGVDESADADVGGFDRCRGMPI